MRSRKKINLNIIANCYLVVFFVVLLNSCTEDTIESENFSSPLYEPCMIVNQEQNNTIEGTYLLIDAFDVKDSSIVIKFPENFYINNNNYLNWVVGWGSQIPLYDAGVENIRAIKKIEFKNKKIYLGELLRGSGLPQNKQHIVFWNKYPSGYKNYNVLPIITPKLWPKFSSKSMSFSAIEFDTLLMKWVMIVSECDTNKMQIYAATSTNLIDWETANSGKPIITPNDFKNCKWAGKDKSGKQIQTASASDIICYKNKWHLFLDGYDSLGKRHIGIATANKTILGPYTINPLPILSPGNDGSWNDDAVFYAKVKKHKNEFILFYDGANKNGYERIGKATSTDIVNWKQYEKNPVLDEHYGWRSSEKCTEPNYIEIKNDTLLLMVAGVKRFNMGAWHHYITKRMYLDKSGNVGDAQLGIYYSTNNGNTFVPHKNNPVFVNNYSNLYENEHLGGNFKLIKTDTANFIFYQAKSSFNELKYNIMLRVLKK